MATLYNLSVAVSAIFAVASGFRLITLGVGMALGGEEGKRQYYQKIKNTLIVFVISLLVGVSGGAIRAILDRYFS